MTLLESLDAFERQRREVKPAASVSSPSASSPVRATESVGAAPVLEKARGLRGVRPVVQPDPEVTPRRAKAPAAHGDGAQSAATKEDTSAPLPDPAEGKELTLFPRTEGPGRARPFVSIYPSKKGRFNLSKAAVHLLDLQDGDELLFAFDADDTTSHFYITRSERGQAAVLRHGYSCHFNYAQLSQHLKLGGIEETARFVFEPEPTRSGERSFYKAVLVD